MVMEKIHPGADWQAIAQEVDRTFDSHFALYSYTKYPAEDYRRFRETFSSFDERVDLESALLWKWGHWGKDNYPAKQQALIKTISALWHEYRQWAGEASYAPEPVATFTWWSERLGRLRYITTAYLTHLIHPQAVPIIDQHNFRAMNHLLQISQPKKKPSDWNDIIQLKSFLDAATVKLERAEGDLDKYLMMYGRALKARISKPSRKAPEPLTAWSA